GGDKRVLLPVGIADRPQIQGVGGSAVLDGTRAAVDEGEVGDAGPSAAPDGGVTAVFHFVGVVAAGAFHHVHIIIARGGFRSVLAIFLFAEHDGFGGLRHGELFNGALGQGAAHVGVKFAGAQLAEEIVIPAVDEVTARGAVDDGNRGGIGLGNPARQI